MIPDSTFHDCSQLTGIIIPASVTEIGGFAFSECENLAAIHFGGSPEQWEEITIGEGMDTLASAKIVYSKQATAASSEQLLWLPAMLNAIESEAFAGPGERGELHFRM